MRGENLEDEWGFDEDLVELVYPFLRFMYERWWRVSVTGAMNVPGHGNAMLVANHAGVLPWDATMISVAIQKEHPLPRYGGSVQNGVTSHEFGPYGTAFRLAAV